MVILDRSRLTNERTIARAIIFYVAIVVIGLTSYQLVAWTKTYIQTNNYAIPSFFQGNWHEYESECYDRDSILAIDGNTIRYDRIDFVADGQKSSVENKIVLHGLSYENGDPVFSNMPIYADKRHNLITIYQGSKNKLVIFRRCLGD